MRALEFFILEVVHDCLMLISTVRTQAAYVPSSLASSLRQTRWTLTLLMRLLHVLTVRNF